MEPINIPLPDAKMMLTAAKIMNTLIWGGITAYTFFAIGEHFASTMSNVSAFLFGFFMFGFAMFIFHKLRKYIWADPIDKSLYVPERIYTQQLISECLANGEDIHKLAETPPEYR